MKLINSTLLTLILFTAIASTVVAEQKPIKFKLSQNLESGSRVLAVGSDGQSKTATISGKTGSVVPPSATSKLYILSADNKVSHQIVNKQCAKAKNGPKKGQLVNCSKKTKVVTTFKAGANLGTLKLQGTATLLGSLSGDKYKKFVVSSQTANATNWEPSGITNKGLGSTSNRARSLAADTGAAESGADSDLDGLINALDIDNDGDSVLDNYDSDANDTPSNGSLGFRVFSNLKNDIDQSINLHTTGLSSSAMDQILSTTQTLAIEVSGSDDSAVELDCGTLGYCSQGGTGSSNSNPFPESFDSDSDGLGTITKGGTGDFQLTTGANTGSIAGGDTFIQRVQTDEIETEIPGTLNFVFVSNPALKSISVNSGATQDIDYAATPILGSRNNCVSVPSTGDVSIELTGWRPQRPGVTEAGEDEFIDIGRSLITADIPNGPSIGSGPSGNGPGNCSAASYSSSDPNLQSSGDGLIDIKPDQTADSSNTYTFQLDISRCLADARSGAISWSSGETLFIDLQFRSSAGDNAAQKFCLTRD